MVTFDKELDDFRRLLEGKANLSFGYEVSALKDGDGIGYGAANGITGIEKFLGYNDTRLKVANFPSISLTHDFITVKAAVCISDEDRVMVDGKEDLTHLPRARGALEVFRDMYGINDHFSFYIEQDKKYDSAKGMGESAAFAASTARALCSLMFRKPSTAFVSSIARLVSGSGSRSAVDGIGLWQSYEGIPQNMNHAIKIKDQLGEFNIASFPKPNPIKTENVHGIAVQSPFYEQWGKLKFHSLINIIENDFDYNMLARAAFNDMLLMHSVLLTKGIGILDERIYNLIKLSDQSEGSLFVTADTGPTPILIYKDPDMLRKAEVIMGRSALKGSLVTGEQHTGQVFQDRARENLIKYT